MGAGAHTCPPALNLNVFPTACAVGVLTIPDIAKEGVDFVNRLQSDNIWVVLVEKTRAGLGWVALCAISAVVVAGWPAALGMGQGGCWCLWRKGLGACAMASNHGALVCWWSDGGCTAQQLLLIGGLRVYRCWYMQPASPMPLHHNPHPQGQHHGEHRESHLPGHTQ